MADPLLLAGGVGHDRRERRRPVLAVAEGVLVHAVAEVPASAHGLPLVRGTPLVPDPLSQHVRTASPAVADRRAVGIRNGLRQTGRAAWRARDGQEEKEPMLTRTRKKKT